MDKPAGYQQFFQSIFHLPGKNSFFWTGKPDGCPGPGSLPEENDPEGKHFIHKIHRLWIKYLWKTSVFAENRTVFHEVINGGEQRHHNCRNRENDHIPCGKRSLIQQDGGSDHDHLAGGFDLAEGTGRDDLSLCNGNEAETVHRQFAAENDDDDPCFHLAAVQQHDQRGQHQELVGNRINEFAEIGDQIVFAGDEPQGEPLLRGTLTGRRLACLLEEGALKEALPFETLSEGGYCLRICASVAACSSTDGENLLWEEQSLELLTLGFAVEAGPEVDELS